MLFAVGDPFLLTSFFKLKCLRKDCLLDVPLALHHSVRKTNMAAIFVVVFFLHVGTEWKRSEYSTH